MVDRLVSGGQTGADRAALDVALELGLATGGWVPRGRRAEDGVIPERYAGLAETASAAYDQRTEYNVRDSDATLVLAYGPPTGGTARTVELARSMGRPLLVLDLERRPADGSILAVREWLDAVGPRVLNVAGPRQSREPRIAAATTTILRGALRPGAAASCLLKGLDPESVLHGDRD